MTIRFRIVACFASKSWCQPAKKPTAKVTTMGNSAPITVSIILSSSFHSIRAILLLHHPWVEDAQGAGKTENNCGFPLRSRSRAGGSKGICIMCCPLLAKRMTVMDRRMAGFKAHPGKSAIRGAASTFRSPTEP